MCVLRTWQPVGLTFSTSTDGNGTFSADTFGGFVLAWIGAVVIATFYLVLWYLRYKFIRRIVV